MLGYEVETLVTDVDESSITAPTPALLAKRLSEEKARRAAELIGETPLPLIAADTLVECKGRIFGKPKDRSEAKDMLLALSGGKHYVHSGLTVIRNGKELSLVESATVWFRELSPAEIEHYLDTGEPMDKAGAYGIQGPAAAFVPKIEGDFFTIVGLPLCRLTEILNNPL